MTDNYIDKGIKLFEKLLGEGFFDHESFDVKTFWNCFCKNYNDMVFISDDYLDSEDIGNFIITLYKIYPEFLEEIAKEDKVWTYQPLFSNSSLSVDIIMPDCKYYYDISSMFTQGAKNIKTLDLSNVDPKYKISEQFFIFGPINTKVEKVIFNNDYVAKTTFVQIGQSPKEIIYQGKSYSSLKDLNAAIREARGW
jgi:hypothetical protein